MNTDLTALAEAHEETAAVLKRLAVGVDMGVECSNDLAHWHSPDDAAHIPGWRFLRVKPQPEEEWRPGDVVVSKEGQEIEFQSWSSDERSTFRGIAVKSQFYDVGYRRSNWITSHFRLLRRAKTPEEIRVENNLKLKDELGEDGAHLAEWRRCFSDGTFGEWQKNYDWIEVDDPSYEFRRKPEAKYRPWTFEDAKEHRGKWVKAKSAMFEGAITGLYTDASCITGRLVSFEEILAEYTFLDGTPCGKEVRE